jgi:hypothetical protein
MTETFYEVLRRQGKAAFRLFESLNVEVGRKV